MSHLLEVSDFAVEHAGHFAARLPQLTLDAGGVAALFGPSGCGKSTLLAAMFGLLERPGWLSSGRVRLAGRSLFTASRRELRRVRRHDVAFLLQDAHGALDPLEPVGRQIQEATGAAPDAIVGMLQRLGVGDAAALVSRLPHQISGGQAQRVLLAIAFLRAPRLVVADEPSASLDGGSYAELVTLLRGLSASGSSLLLATHDLRLLRDLDADVHAFAGGAFVRAAAVEQPWPQRVRGEVGIVPVLEGRDLVVRYGDRRVLDGVGIALHRGEIVALLGESGAGKTTLLRVLAGHRAPDAGRVLAPPRRGAVQLVCQDASASLTPRRRLRRLLAEAAVPYFDAEEGAASVQLAEPVLDRSTEAMSGGERRRAALLRALAVLPDVLLLDEPTASLDRTAANAVVANLLSLQQGRGLAMLLVTHDQGLAEAVADRSLEIRGGRLCPVAP